MPAKPVTRDDHLAQTEDRSERGEEADGHDTEQVEEEDDENGIDETKEEDRFA